MSQLDYWLSLFPLCSSPSSFVLIWALVLSLCCVFCWTRRPVCPLCPDTSFEKPGSPAIQVVVSLDWRAGVNLRMWGGKPSNALLPSREIRGLSSVCIKKPMLIWQDWKRSHAQVSASFWAYLHSVSVMLRDIKELAAILQTVASETKLLPVQASAATIVSLCRKYCASTVGELSSLRSLLNALCCGLPHIQSVSVLSSSRSGCVSSTIRGENFPT